MKEESVVVQYMPLINTLGGDIDVKHQEKAIPSFSELEMLINLYFPKMVDIHNQYSKSRQQLLFHALDVKFIDLNTGQFKNTGEYIAKLDHLDNEYRKCMDGIKAHIMSAIKA